MHWLTLDVGIGRMSGSYYAAHWWVAAPGTDDVQFLVLGLSNILLAGINYPTSSHIHIPIHSVVCSELCFAILYIIKYSLYNLFSKWVHLWNGNSGDLETCILNIACLVDVSSININKLFW